MNDMLGCRAGVGHRQARRACRPPGRRQDRHVAGFPRCLVRRLHGAIRRRRVGRQRRRPGHEQGDGRQPAGAAVARRHAASRTKAARRSRCRAHLPLPSARSPVRRRPIAEPQPIAQPLMPRERIGVGIHRARDRPHRRRRASAGPSARPANSGWIGAAKGLLRGSDRHLAGSRHQGRAGGVLHGPRCKANQRARLLVRRRASSPTPRSDAGRCPRGAASAWPLRAAARRSATSFQKRGPWFISSRCATSCAAT